MKREVEFRAISITEQIFVYGCLNIYLNGKHKSLITNFEGTQSWNVAEKTIGQYTGLKDKNKTKIYEGYLLQVPESETMIAGIHEVFYYKDGFVTSSILFNEKETANKNSLTYIIDRGATVIGNIYQKK